jgi:hypothetical protein
LAFFSGILLTLGSSSGLLFDQEKGRSAEFPPLDPDLKVVWTRLREDHPLKRED